MYKIAFVVSYCINNRGGDKMPAYFPVWLESCQRNPSVDFLLFLDTKESYDWPGNVKVFYMDFDQQVKLFQSKFDFLICADTPYKFCDFRVAFGEVFAEYLAGYDFWGYCDIDLIWGDIRSFVTDEVLSKYDRVYTHGHCSLWRNTPVVNSYYRTLPANGYQDWKTVLSTHGSFAFDEWAGHAGGGISFIIKSNGIPYYDEPDMADLKIA